MTVAKILVVQLARLGDLVQTWPLLRQLPRAFPGARLGLLADRRLKSLMALGPEVEEFWGLDLEGLAPLTAKDLPAAYEQLARSVEDLKAGDYDLVFNLNFSRLSLLFTHLVGSRARGYRPAAGGREFFREPWLALMFGLVHARKYNRLHLSDVFRHLSPPGPGEPEPLRPRPPEGDPVIALQLGTRHPRRTWPLESFRLLIRILVERLGARVWLLGTAEERPGGEVLTRGLPAAVRERVVNFQGRTDLGELAARLRAASLLVSGDTGTLHLAAALGTKTVGVFFGPASCFETGPYGEGHYVIQAEPPCHPCLEASGCAEPFCPAMAPPEAVGELVSGLWREGRAPAAFKLPVNTRVYQSYLDPLGVSYRPLGEDLRFQDLIGLAYRWAGLEVLGENSLRLPTLSGPLNGADRLRLEGVAAALQNGVPGKRLSSEVAGALTPLWAYRRELHRQRTRGGGEAEARFAFEAVKRGLLTRVEEWLGR